MTERKFTHPKDAEEGHKWQTVDGRKVRIYAHDAGGDYPIHGAVWNSTMDDWMASVWTEVGGLHANGDISTINLVDAPRMVKVQGYVNVLPDGDFVGPFPTSVEADVSASLYNNVARIKIDMEVEKGRFDD